MVFHYIICYLHPFFAFTLHSLRWHPCTPPRLSHQECLFCCSTMHVASGDIGVRRVRSSWATVHTLPVRIAVCSHNDTFLLLTNVHSFTADDVQRFDDGCPKSKQIWGHSFTFTSCFLFQFSSNSKHLTYNKPSI